MVAKPTLIFTKSSTFMSRPTDSIHGQWSSRWTFILAATGSAVGLGNIWKFPYIAGENGGGAFVLVYLLCIAAIGLPLMMAEVMIGRRGRQNPVWFYYFILLQCHCWASDSVCISIICRCF